MLVEMDGSKKGTMNLHHGQSLSHIHTLPRSQTAALSPGSVCVPQTLLLLSSFTCPHLCFLPIDQCIHQSMRPISGHLEEGGKIIYSSFQDTVFSSI